MKVFPLLLALLSAMCNAGANIALRQAGLGRTILIDVPTPVGRFSDWYVAAVAFYFASFLAYAIAMKSLSAPVAYPIIIGGAYLLTVAATWTLTREAVPWQTLAGGLIVVLGLIVIVTGEGARTAAI